MRTPSASLPSRTVPADVVESIHRLVVYLWYDHEEERHWLESDEPEAHIFEDVKKVSDWLDAKQD
jgi:hypothetical protein